MVNRGGIKKKFQIKALRVAERRTGSMSNKTASSETVTNKSNATTLYPIKFDNPKHAAETAMIIEMQYRNCFRLSIFLNKNFSI
jgi:hypothetical protein